MKTGIDKNESELDKMKREAMEWIERYGKTAPPFISVAVNAFRDQTPLDKFIDNMTEEDIEKAMGVAHGTTITTDGKEHSDGGIGYDSINVKAPVGKTIYSGTLKSCTSHVGKSQPESAKEWFNDNAHDFVNDGYSVRRVMDRETFLKYVAQFKQPEITEITDIIDCILKFDSSENDYVKAEYFDVIQRDLKQLKTKT